MKNKIINIIIALILIISITVRFTYVMNHINHKCDHDNCPICNIINNFKNDLKNILPSKNKIIIIIIPIILFNVIKTIKNTYNIYSLINLKVRLNN